LFANPYYAAGLIGALVFWIWPAFLYKSLDAHWLTVSAVSVLLFAGAGSHKKKFRLSAELIIEAEGMLLHRLLSLA
jgi:hypothetical protein